MTVVPSSAAVVSGRAWPVVAVGVWLLVMVAGAAPRNVGDSSEYLGMAINLAAGRAPSLSEDELRHVRTASAQPDAGFELETRRIPEMRGADGRYDMPHMWVYPLLATPGVWLSRLAGAPPAWGFLFTNVGLVAGLGALIAWRGGAAWALAIVATPLVWWVDKPLAEVLMACGLGAATLLFPTHSGTALIVLGVLAAQNPALVVACVTFGIAALLNDPRRLRDWRWCAGAGAGAVCAAIGPAYYLWRLDRLSPLTSYAEASWPALSTLLYPLTDTNMGLFVRFPPALALVLLPLARRAGWRAAGAVPAAVTAVALLVVCSQQPNMNQGGNPDLSRYAMWLLPLTLPWLVAADAAARPTRWTGFAVLAISMAWTMAAFPLSRPESYRYPTPLASWLWTRHPSWTTPRPEAFAERTSHREPAQVPTATPGCEKVLLYEGLWPASCPPSYAEVPTSCLATGAFCYADAYGLGMHTVRVVGVVPGYRPELHGRTWRAGQPDTNWVSGATRGLQPGTPPATHASVRGVWDVTWTQTWWGADGTLLVYARNVGQRGRVAVRAPARSVVRVSTLGAEGAASEIDATRDEPAVIGLPAAPHALVTIVPTSASSNRPDP